MTQSDRPRVRSILVPLDGSKFAEEALPYAAAIGRDHAELVLLEVVPEPQPARGLLGEELLSAEQVRRAYEGGARTRLESARERWLAERSDVRLEIATGDPAEQILQVTQQLDTDLIVMATHGLDTFGRWVIGSVADRVARTSPIPVMLIRGEEQQEQEKEGEGPTRPRDGLIEGFVVPLDGSDLAKLAIPFATELASLLHVPITLVAVSDIPRQLTGLMAYGAAFSAQAYEDLVAAGRAEVEEMLAAAANTVRESGVSVSYRVLDGQGIAETIAGAAGPNDVIVMTSHGRGGIGRWLLGSVATKLIQIGTVPVVLVPSPGRRDKFAD